MSSENSNLDNKNDNIKMNESGKKHETNLICVEEVDKNENNITKDGKNENKGDENGEIEYKEEDVNENNKNANTNENKRFLNYLNKFDFNSLKEKLGCTNEDLIDILLKMYENEEEEEEEESFADHNYGSPDYWDDRYLVCPEPFDWYRKWDLIEQTLKPLFNGEEMVLNIGCGNSEMSADMQRSMFPYVVSIDISSVVINQMREKYNYNKNLFWFTMDCTHMTFDDDVFDIVFDKGTFDALMCGDESTLKVLQSLEEIRRVLQPGGLFIEITYGRPDDRCDIFAQAGDGWDIYDPIILDNPNDAQVHYIYIFQKITSLSSIEAEQKGEGDQDQNENQSQDKANINEEQISDEKLEQKENVGQDS